jgi:hypothetical protein
MYSTQAKKNKKQKTIGGWIEEAKKKYRLEHRKKGWTSPPSTLDS